MMLRPSSAATFPRSRVGNGILVRERQECVAQLFGEWGGHQTRPVLPHAGNLLFPVGDKLLSAVVHAIVIKC